MKKLNHIGIAVASLAATLAAPSQAAAPNLVKAGAIGDQTPRVYIVQLAEAPLAVYDGRMPGLPATRAAKGGRLNAKTTAAQQYLAHLDQKRKQVLSRLGGVQALHSYSTVFNGFSAKLTPAQAASLMTSADVRLVTPSEVYRPVTTRTPGMLGISEPNGVWSQLDPMGRQIRGEDVIIGVLDTGIWPEDPNFGDKQDATGRPVAYHASGTQVYGPAPAKWAGVCQTGPGFTASMCNNKVIDARFYSSAFLANGAVAVAGEFMSPREGDSHGSHTASTAGGNSNVHVVGSNGVTTAIMSGMAPRARLAIYKVCWEATVDELSGCHTGDTLAAIDDAVRDGVDVINFSVGGTLYDYVDPVETAFLNATAAGVFVAASAGNDGPTPNTVAHIAPWLTTVGSGTVDRAAGGGDLILGDGSKFSGYSLNFFGVTSGNLILSSAIPAAGQTSASAGTCKANSLDTAAATGKIVVCDRRTSNTSTNRLAESAEVKRAGGIGMILLNTDTATPVADAHTIPTVQLTSTDRAAVQAYAQTSGASGTIGLSRNRPGVTAPVISTFSSRGPGLANQNLLKPDIVAPGSSIVAATRASLSQTQHDQVIAGTLTPAASTGTLSGTSMSSPHVAGLAALLRDLYPAWSPAAIKSALLTSTTPVKLSSGNTDTNRWNTGAGFVNPNGAAVPSLVYDSDISDYGRFLCGLGLTPPTSSGKCDTLGSIKPWDLNLATLQVDRVTANRTLSRTITNVSTATRTYVASASVTGWSVSVTPASLTLAPGASAKFDVKLTRGSSTLNDWTFGTLSWSDGTQTTTSPLNVRGIMIAAPEELTDVRTLGRGSKVFNVDSGYTGAMGLSAIGLVPAVVNTSTVLPAESKCFSFVVPAGSSFARFQLFQSDVTGSNTDLDLYIYRSADCTGSTVATSGGPTAAEVVTLDKPSAATYSAKVTGYATPADGATFKLHSWVVGPASGPQTLKVTGPNLVQAGSGATVAVSWDVPAGTRYMGAIQYSDASSNPVGTVKLVVDNH